MATTVEGQIVDTVIGAIAADLSAYNLALPGVAFVPDGSLYLDVSLLPNGVEREPIGTGETTYRGIAQVAVMYPDGAGIVKPADVAGEIVALFPRGRVIRGDVDVLIASQPTIAAPYPDGQYMRLPVTIRYLASA